VAALATGVVDQLLVVEDQFVKQGEPIARLVARDAELALQQAIATEGMRKAETEEAQATLTAARTNLEFPTHLEFPLAEAEVDLTTLETELTNLPNLLKRAEARFRLADADWKAKSENKQSIQAILVVRAQSEFDAAQSEVDELTKRRPALELQREALVRKRAAAAKRLELKTDETRAVSAAIAHLSSFEAQHREAQTRVEEAQLRLERMTIRAPVSGRVLNLIANPGSQLMTGPSQMEARDSNTVVTMYQPDQMQVRVDVRFEDLPRVGRDQPVQVKSPAFPEAISGRVLFLTSFANVQKNTLAVKVSLDAPPSVLKPEMLVDVTFLAAEQPSRESGEKSQDPTEEYRLFLPRSVVDIGSDGNSVWVADLVHRVARRQSIQLGALQTATLLEVTGGLTAASRIISGGRENLIDGDRIEVQGEDTQLGTGVSDGKSTPATPAPHGQHPEK
jgi:multidrug resistance efflux pump